MFDVTGNFQHGVYHADCFNKVNGFQAMVMQSQEDADRVITCFTEAIAAGYDPTLVTVQNAVFKKAGVDILTLDDYDIKRIENKVQEVWESKNNVF